MNSMVMQALKDVGAPIFYQRWKKTEQYSSPPKLYVVFYEMLNQEGLVASDETWSMEHYIRVDAYGDGSLDKTMEEVYEGMTKTGFLLRRAQDIPDEYGYHKSSTWVYYRNLY